MTDWGYEPDPDDQYPLPLWLQMGNRRIVLHLNPIEARRCFLELALSADFLNHQVAEGLPTTTALDWYRRTFLFLEKKSPSHSGASPGPSEMEAIRELHSIAEVELGISVKLDLTKGSHCFGRLEHVYDKFLQRMREGKDPEWSADLPFTLYDPQADCVDDDRKNRKRMRPCMAKISRGWCLWLHGKCQNLRERDR